ncbi:nicotinic acid mononucleotide adenylyltransferase [Crenothrix sp. D3]|nr:nicotinic acid mononucleotide adenylyltransferase [Crenothrix sp. D3]
MIGIFGGTFDPIHYGHLRSALEMKEAFDLTDVRFIPSAIPPHRNQPTATAEQRLQMVTLAIQNQENFICDARELNRHGFSYMVDTLASLRQDFPNQPLLLFIGTDAFNQLNSWYQWQRLVDFAHIVVMTRPSVDSQPLDDFFTERYTTDKTELTTTLAGKLYFHAVTQLDISATAIRQLIAQQRDPRFLLPDAVIDYITQQQLYEIT